MSATVLSTRENRTLSIRERVAARPLAAFFFGAYTGAWLMLLPLLLAQNGLGVLPFRLPTTLFLILATFSGPALSAVLVAWAMEGRTGIEKLLARYRARRSSYLWFLIALYGPLLAIAAVCSIELGSAPLEAILRQPLVFVSSYSALILGALPTGPLGEELGWRGFALPRLQKSVGPVWGSLALGVLWAGWHLPLFFLPDWKGAADPLQIGLAFSSWVIPFTFIMTWVYNSAQGSVLISTIMHSAENAAVSLIALHLLVAPNDTFLQTKVYWVVAIVLVVATRGKLAIGKFREVEVQPAAEQAPAGSRKRLTPRTIALAVVLGVVAAWVAVNIGYDLIHGTGR